ncbi:methylosome subunit pICln-like [Ciona intestinalis]
MYAVQAPNTGIQHRENTCKANVNNTDFGQGTLYIAESELIWIGSSNQGFRLQYTDIAIHAISTDVQSFPEECLYVMYNKSLFTSSQSENESDSDGEKDSTVSEIRFIPTDKNNLKRMFDALSDCQCLHPDEEDSDFFDEGEVNEGSVQTYDGGAAGEGFFTGDAAIDHMTPQGLATMQRLEAMLAQQQGNPSTDTGIETDMNGVHITEQQNGTTEDGQFDDA